MASKCSVATGSYVSVNGGFFAMTSILVNQTGRVKARVCGARLQPARLGVATAERSHAAGASVAAPASILARPGVRAGPRGGRFEDRTYPGLQRPSGQRIIQASDHT